MRLLRYLWALPNTALGLLFSPLAFGRDGKLQIVEGVIEICSPSIGSVLRTVVPIAGGASAITFGHVVLGRDSVCLAATRSHERVHVRQYELWGPLFIPAYLIAGLWALARGRGAYAGNHFELQALLEADKWRPAR
jgi:hypothetical protein